MKRLSLILIFAFFLPSLVAAAQMAGVPGEDQHHSDSYSHSVSADDATVDQHLDQCDHCCQCHGHCSHLTPIAHIFSLAEYGASRSSFALLPAALARIPSSIDRPPIV